MVEEEERKTEVFPLFVFYDVICSKNAYMPFCLHASIFLVG